MMVSILLFAQLAESIDARSIDIEVREGATVADLLDILHEQHPAISAMRGSIAVAVDERYARPDTPLRPGQIIALIPPVSGG